MRVSDVMSTDVVVARINEPLSDAVYRMLEKNVGCIVVTDGPLVAGIITKGDVLRKAFLLGLDAREVSAKRVMSSPVVTTTPDTSLEEASKILSANKISKLPVLKGSKLVGVITSTDIIGAEPMQVAYLQELVRARFVPHDLA